MSELGSPAFINWLSTIVILIGAALIASVLFTVWTDRRFTLSPQNRIWTFIASFALLGSLATAPLADAHSWVRTASFCATPLTLILLYFLPTTLGIAARNRSYQAIFMLDLFFGWTVIGWFAALVWAVTRSTADRRPAYRITPFGAVPERSTTGSRKPV
jgi:hypothetical protein